MGGARLPWRLDEEVASRAFLVEKWEREVVLEVEQGRDLEGPCWDGGGGAPTGWSGARGGGAARGRENETREGEEEEKIITLRFLLLRLQG
jgi:hypothetical protein